jgi:hypothetical protein
MMNRLKARWIRAWSTAEHGMVRPVNSRDKSAVSLEVNPSGGTYTFIQGGTSISPAIPYNAPPGWPRDPANCSITDLEDRFRHHPPATDARRMAHVMVREDCLRLAKLIDELLPNCREKSTAVTNLEQVMFWSNAGIARQSNDGDNQ